MVGQLIQEYGLVSTIKLVASEKNISDTLTPVPKEWLLKVPHTVRWCQARKERQSCRTGCDRTEKMCYRDPQQASLGS